MPKFLLIYPRFAVHEETDFNIPMGPLHLGTFLRANGIEFRFIDCVVENNYQDLIAEELGNCLAVGISTMTAQVPCAIEVCSSIRKRRPDLPIVWGGVHATLFSEQVLRSGFADYVVVGEGELPLLGLVCSLGKSRQPEDVGGICYLSGGGSFRAVTKGEQFDFRRMPPIDYSLLSQRVLGNYQTHYVGIQTSRGCPYRCSFCINPLIKEYRKWRAWSAKRTCDEIERVIQLGCKRIWFWDENFFVDKRRIARFVEEVERRGLGFEWFANVRADYFGDHYLNEGLLKRLYEIGWRRASIGAESGSQKVLEHLCKDITLENTLRAALLCNKANLDSNFSFMIGLPQEKEGDIRKTVFAIRQIAECYPSAKFLGPQLFRPYPGSNLYQECLDAGFEGPKTLLEWAKAISSGLMESDPFKMPWIDNPKFVNIVWFYSIMIPLSYKKILHLFAEYCQVYRKSKLMLLAGSVAMVLMATLGKLRYKLSFYHFPVETKIFRKYRVILSC